MPPRYNGIVRALRRIHLLVSLLAAPLSAACLESSLQSGWLWNYEGTIGANRVRLTLTRLRDGLEGFYFYSKFLKDVPLRGRIIDGSHIELTELDSAGRPTATLEGHFPESDPRGRFKGELRCEVIVGSWRKQGDSQSLPLYLGQDSGVAGTLDHRYVIAGAADDELVHRNALRFWNAVAAGDRQTVASLVAYPIRASVGGKPRSLRNRGELLAHYDEIFSKAFREAIAGALPRNMFARDQGIMLGSGEVWFNSKGKAFALNNVR